MKQSLLFTSIFVIALLVGCATPSVAPQAAMPAAAPATAAYPITIENCGNTLTFAKAPERVLATYQNVAEILVALGLTDKIVGVTYGQAYDPLPEMAEAVNGLNWLSPRGKGSAVKEVTLSTQPDFVLSAYPTYDFDASQGMATQEEFVAAGAPVYGVSAECTAQVPDGTIESVYNDILNIGRIMGVEARAVALVQQMRDQIAAVQQKVADQPRVPMAFYDAGEDPLGVYGSGLNADMIKLAGGQNVFGDQPEVYLQVSKEAFAVTTPEIFAIIDYEGNPAVPEEAARAEYLFTTFPNLPASQNRRYVAVPGSAFAAGVRIPIAIETMARAFHPAAFATTPASSTDDPVTIENCGNTLTFDQPPARVLSMTQNATEMLLALGLQDRIVGAATLEVPLPPAYATAFANVPVLTNTPGLYPSVEVVLSTNPDFMISNVPSAFSAENLLSREELQAQRIGSYLFSPNCPDRSVPPTIELVYTDILNLGRIFGVEARAQEVVAQMQREIADVQAKLAMIDPATKPRVFVFDSDEQAPWTIGNAGIAHHIITTAGGEPIFADQEQAWVQVSWEEVVDRDPQVIIPIQSGSGEGGADTEKIQRLLGLPQLTGLTAIAEQRFINDANFMNVFEAGVRNAEGIRMLAAAFYPEAFK